MNGSKGFSLIEIAIVLVIVGVLIGSFVTTLTTRIENTRRSETLDQLNVIKDAIIGFATVNGRIPCPADTNTNGNEDPAGGGPCNQQHGFVPGALLGIQGKYNLDTLLLDSWNNPIRYSVTSANVSAFTTNGGMAAIGIALLNPNLNVCNVDSANVDTCSAGLITLTNSAPFIILSLGKDGSQWVGAVPVANTDQKENSGEVLTVANAAGENVAYLVGGGQAFVSRNFSEVGAAAGYYDDILIWESPFVLYKTMIETGVLP